jgi:hypothetical protein
MRKPGRQAGSKLVTRRQLAGPQPPRPALSVSTGLALSATGAILLLAVHVRLSFLSVPATGLILLMTGITWLLTPVRAKRAMLRRHFVRVMGYLQWDGTNLSQTRRPLTEMLADGATPADASRPVL